MTNAPKHKINQRLLNRIRLIEAMIKVRFQFGEASLFVDILLKTIALSTAV